MAILTRLWARTAVPGPDPGPVEVIEAAAVPAVLPFEGADAGFAAGAPLHCSAERRAVLAGLAGLAGFALARDDYRAHAELVQVVLDRGLAVAAVGGHGARAPPGAPDDPTDGRGELGRVGRVAAFDGVVEHDPVVVVDDLALVAELDRPTEPALGDRAGVTIVQADPPGCTVRDGPGQPLPGLGGDPSGRVQQVGQVVDRTAQPAPPPPRDRVRDTRPRPARRPWPGRGAALGGRWRVASRPRPRCARPAQPARR